MRYAPVGADGSGYYHYIPRIVERPLIMQNDEAVRASRKRHATYEPGVCPKRVHSPSEALVGVGGGRYAVEELRSVDSAVRVCPAAVCAVEKVWIPVNVG